MNDKIVLRLRAQADEDRREAINFLVRTLAFLVDGGEIPDMFGERRPPLIKIATARETLKHAGVFLTRAIANEKKSNKRIRAKTIIRK